MDSTIISVENATVNVYKNSVSLNVGKSSIVKINPENEATPLLKKISSGDASYNLSQFNQINCLGQSSDLSKEKIVLGIKRDLEDIELEEQKLKIRKVVLRSHWKLFLSLIHISEPTRPY